MPLKHVSVPAWERSSGVSSELLLPAALPASGLVPTDLNFALAFQEAEGRQSECHIFLIVTAIMSLISLPTPLGVSDTRRCCGPCQELGRAAAAEELGEPEEQGQQGPQLKGHTDTVTKQAEQSRSGDSNHIWTGDQWAHGDVPGLRPSQEVIRISDSQVHSQAQTPLQPTPKEDWGQGQLCAMAPNGSGEAPAGFSQLFSRQLFSQHSDPRSHSTVSWQTSNTGSQTCRTGVGGCRISWCTQGRVTTLPSTARGEHKNYSKCWQRNLGTNMPQTLAVCKIDNLYFSCFRVW